MPFFGAHISIAGGVHFAPERGYKVGCNAIQLFTKNARQWKASPLKEEEIINFKEDILRFKIYKVIAHDGYLINLAAPDDRIFSKSFESFTFELRRAELLDIPYLVMHPGSHLGKGEDYGIKKIAKSLNESLLESETKKVKILLETTAGQGTNLGYTFEQIRDIIDMVDKKDRFGICLDTAHIFAAGYDIRSREAYEETMEKFDKILGISNLFVIHTNDSKSELGSHVDRHEHIGFGKIGKDPFSFFINDPRLKDLPFILETPDGRDWDIVNLETLRNLQQ